MTTNYFFFFLNIRTKEINLRAVHAWCTYSLKITLTQHQHSIMSKYFKFPSLLTNKNITVLLESRLLKF